MAKYSNKRYVKVNQSKKKEKKKKKKKRNDVKLVNLHETLITFLINLFFRPKMNV